MSNNSTLRFVRWFLLLSILILATMQGWLHQRLKLFPSIDAFCPFGALESMWAMIRYQTLLRRVAWSGFILLFITVGTALLFRRSFCGNVCPLGALQEFFGLTGRGLFRRRFNLPGWLDRLLRWLKYPVLVLFIASAWKTMTLAVRPYDPWIAYHHLTSDELFSEYLIGTIILGASLVGGLFSDRPFCRYLCPMGGFLALPSKLGLSRVTRNESSCIDCGECDAACPMGLEIAAAEKVTSAECISCGECVNTCPVDNTLQFSLPGKSARRISPWIVTAGTVFIFVAVLAVTTLTGSYVWKADTGLEHRAERLLWGPQRIKEDNTMVDIVQVYQINPGYLAQEFGLAGEEDFYQSFKQREIDPGQVEALVNRLYEEAGLDPKELLGGGGGGGGCGGH